MRCMVLEETADVTRRPLVRRDREAPRPADGQVLVRVRACGVCHTDLHTVEGELPRRKLPVIPGHQVVGVVEEVGAGVEAPRAGTRVGITWLHRSCGSCDFCRDDRENLCDKALFTGYDVDGGYAELVVAPQDFVYALPPKFPDVEAAPLLCAGIIGYRALRLSGIRPGRRLGLYGFGASAHIVIQVARFWGCEVFVFTRSEEHRALARSLGAAWTGGAEDEPPDRIHAAIVFAPAGRLVPRALRVMEKGGVVALAGIYMSPIPEMEYALLYHERSVRSVANCTREDARELLRIAGRVPIRTTVETFPLEEANDALIRLKRSEIRGAGVLVL